MRDCPHVGREDEHCPCLDGAERDQSECMHCGDQFPTAVLRDIHEHECQG